jgi:hypothetical protein
VLPADSSDVVFGSEAADRAELLERAAGVAHRIAALAEARRTEAAIGAASDAKRER